MLFSVIQVKIDGKSDFPGAQFLFGVVDRQESRSRQCHSHLAADPICDL